MAERSRFVRSSTGEHLGQLLTSYTVLWSETLKKTVVMRSKQ
jgi:hypothetical protein